MTRESGTAKLYTPQILALAVELANVPLDSAHTKQGSARSQSCGSTLDISLELDSEDRISAIGMQVSACAIGQASAAIFVRHAKGSSVDEINASQEALEQWLGRAGPLPSWPEIELLDAAADYPARHGAIVLPWRAANAALSKPTGER